MKHKAKTLLVAGIALLVLFIIWTVLIMTVDVKPVGVKETDVGFSTVNVWFHKLTGLHMGTYTLTDWLGFVPIAVCLVFAVVGLIQLIKRKSLIKVDADILLLGAFYILVIAAYFIFEMIPINYRPVLIDGRMEASYPSSTTLLVLSVMPTLIFEVERRVKNAKIRLAIDIFAIAFSAFMTIGRAISGVHWLTDIVGAILLSAGLFLIYFACVAFVDGRGDKSQINTEE